MSLPHRTPLSFFSFIRFLLSIQAGFYTLHSKFRGKITAFISYTQEKNAKKCSNRQKYVAEHKNRPLR